MADVAEPTSFLRMLYRAALPAAVRAPLYSLRHSIFNRSHVEAGARYSYTVQPSIPIVAPILGPEPEPAEKYPLNRDGIPMASACIVPALHSEPQPDIPERMMVGNPPREQLYL